MKAPWYRGEPITLPRWVLQIKYLLFAILAIRVACTGLTALEEAHGRAYVHVWSSAVVIGATVALIASIRARWEHIEKWADVWLAGWLIVVAVSSLLIGRESGFWVVLVVTALPAGRAFSLFVREGKNADPI